MSDELAATQKGVPYTLKVASLPHAVREEPSLRPTPLTLQQALSAFGQQLVMQASDECRVLPHILHLIGKGGEHIVFEDLRYPNYVLKVDFIESLPVLYAQIRGQEEIDAAVTKLQEKAAAHNERLKILQSFFPLGSVPLELVAVKNLPVTEEVVLGVMRDRNLDIPKHLTIPQSLPLLCTIQHKIDLPKDNRVNIYSSYAELNRTILLEYYLDGHRLLAGAEPIGPADPLAREKIIYYIYPSLRSVGEKIGQDQKLKKVLGQYVKQAMAYSVETGEIIDMAGGGNVLLIKNPDGHWQPFLMDALSPPELNFKLLKQASLMIKHGQDLDVHTKANVLNVINYIRFANALAMLAGLPDRLDVPGMTEISGEDWYKNLIIEKYFDVYTPKKAPGKSVDKNQADE
ncbi:MAG: hypothetical protein PHC70_05170 [Patescibacteria group bacterium]|nr:hypothetical protein [Patescibacteria group bacterium]